MSSLPAELYLRILLLASKPTLKQCSLASVTLAQLSQPILFSSISLGWSDDSQARLSRKIDFFLLHTNGRFSTYIREMTITPHILSSRLECYARCREFLAEVAPCLHTLTIVHSLVARQDMGPLQYAGDIFATALTRILRLTKNLDSLSLIFLQDFPLLSILKATPKLSRLCLFNTTLVPELQDSCIPPSTSLQSLVLSPFQESDFALHSPLGSLFHQKNQGPRSLSFGSYTGTSPPFDFAFLEHLGDSLERLDLPHTIHWVASLRTRAKLFPFTKFSALKTLGFTAVPAPLRRNSMMWASFFRWFSESVAVSQSRIISLRLHLRLSEIWSLNDVAIPIPLKDWIATLRCEVVLVLEGREGHVRDEAAGSLIVRQIEDIFGQFSPVRIVREWL
ncbi:hypothetical protein DL96DRAFT_1587956 [Flagelloscypha sp. PMI_526]|nr:hypothetical protein DL96DRAFT_1587956 [Flagelloscypha sp. PMI_526]